MVALEPEPALESESVAAAPLSVGAPIAYPVFASQNPFGLEGEVESYGPMAAVGDFNEDGHADLAIENNYTAVIVRLGNGAGGFGAETIYSLGGGTGYNAIRPNAVIARDLNADGHLDLVTSNAKSLSVLLGTGTGTFGAVTSYAFPGCNWEPCHGSVTTADVNGDGKLDLATGMNGGLGVFLGTGTGAFGALATHACGTSTTHHNSVIAGDFNNDGRVDFATASSWGSNAYLFTGNGNGTFAACTSHATGSRPQSMTSGDFNGDGRLDLATTNNWGIDLTVLLNQGGTFTSQSIPFSGSEYQILFVGAAHVDGDGDLDLLVGHQNKIFVLAGGAGGTFSQAETIELSAPARFIQAGNFNADPAGLIDLLVSSDSGQVLVLPGQAAPAPCTSGCTPSVISSTYAVTASAAPGASGGLAIARPGLLANGDILYAFLTKGDNAGVLTAPAGWTQLGQWSTTSDDFTTGVWRKVVSSAGAEPASYAWRHSDSTSEEMSASIVAVRGANPASPEDAAVVHAAGINNPSPSSPSITTASARALVLIHQGVTRTSFSNVYPPFGATLHQFTRGTDRNSAVGSFTQAAPGATGAKSWNNIGSTSSADWHTLTIAVRPL